MILTTLMAHQRKLIRQAVVALLISANTSALARVQATRVEPHRQSQLPAIAVYTLSESAEESMSAPRELTRNLKLEVTAWVAHSDTLPVDDAMDNIAEQIEAAMSADRYLANTAAESILESCEMQVVEDDGRSDPLVGIVTLTYSVTYRTAEGVIATDAFISVYASETIAGSVPSTTPAQDTFTV